MKRQNLKNHQFYEVKEQFKSALILIARLIVSFSKYINNNFKA